MTLQVLFANNAGTTLAAPITDTQTSISVTSGTGALFPAPAAGQFFSLTLSVSGTPTTLEITYCTARSGDTLTVIRAQESTTALAFNAGDNAQNLLTAGDLALFSQIMAYSGRLVGIQTFATAGTHTYTPNPAAKTCIACVQAGGGAGGGAGSAGSGNVSLGAPGCSGSYAEGEYSAASLAGLTITVGAGGVAVSGGAGGNGGASSIGSVMVCPGGPAGSTLTNQVPPTTNGNGNSSTAASGGNIFASVGSCNSPTIALTNLTGFGGAGGASLFGPGGFSSNPNVTGFSALNYGSGGAGVMVNASGGTIFGGAGMGGIVIIYEYS